jgi:gliding motility-associated-like protein
VGSNSYSQSGTYLDTLRSIANCDSIIQTILTVNNPINIAIQPIICKGEVFTVGNQQYTFAGNYIDTLISSLGCDSIIQTSLTVNNIISTALNDSICTGETYFFNGQAINNSGIYLSTFTSNSGCDSIVTLTLSLLPNPKVVASANPYSIFVGGDIQLLTFPDSSVFQYNWSPATGLSNPSISAPIATPETTTIYTVEVTYVNGCISSDTVRINVFDPCNLQIPNAFTPNDDGINDCFKILGFNEFDNFSCMIFDRWGEKVFESNNPNICWDGKYKNENAPMDSYFYIVRFDCNKTARKVKGMVSLLR